MEEENKAVVEEQEINYKELYEKAQKDLEAVVKKKDELLNETKEAKRVKREAEEARQRIEQEKAQKDGEFEKLWQSAEEKRKELENRLLDIKKQNRNEKIENYALKIAGELADGDNVELLSDFVKRTLDKLAEEDGTLSADVLNATKEEYMNNTKFKSLLRGSKASGGGATGNAKTNVVGKEMSRADFNNLDHAHRAKFFADGGKLTD